MTTLMIDHHLRSPTQEEEEDPEDVRAVARARTKTLLRRLDGERKGHVVQFLYESGLIARDHTVVDLSEAYLSEADLSGTDLSGADLTKAELSGADLSWALLIGANLEGAGLSGVNLSDAHLEEANLEGAELIGTTLINADLTGATVLEEQLEHAEPLERATMPNGQKYEDWLKSKGGGEDGENSSPS